ncbi:pre-mRNA-splicing regulator female-lethal(2)D isoform X1 [Halyomorpha halys]|uniref:pre-mRNA-splicing regulator female-lethal(2)D isoform X1 n=1 Tax=Halyomorpha halys TaxID=286706 RepID=UPI0006D4F3EE|nr:pre-mRNA-splicing regulator female-lethal(2)D isoform X1 [Halyomorpha halys]
MSNENNGNDVPEDGGEVPSARMDCEAPGASDLNTKVTRVELTNEQLKEISLEELRTCWKRQDSYINMLESRNSIYEEECTNLKDAEEKLRNQVAELSFRERVLMRRLAAKEQDMQEFAGQLSELKVSQVPGNGALRNTLLDPAVNLLLQRLRQELSETRTRLDDTQNELSAWKFTPDSNTGKRLMAKCRLLYQENEELGAMVSKGRLAKLEGDLALQKSFSEEVKKSQSELDELLQDLDEDVEGMQSTIYYLQQELKKAKETLSSLEHENSLLRRTEVIKSPVGQVNGLPLSHNKWNRSSDSIDSTTDHVMDDLQRTKDLDPDSVVNNNVEGQRKRTSSENSDEHSIIKKAKQESVHYSDDEIVTNGDNGGQ